MKPRTLRTHRSRRGSTVTEFAIWLPVMVIIFSGMVDLSWQLSQYQKLVRITRDAARVAAATYENPQFMEPGSLSISAGEDYARDACARLNIDDCDIKVERLEGSPPIMQVQISYDVTPVVGILPLDTEVNSQFSMAYEFL